MINSVNKLEQSSIEGFKTKETCYQLNKLIKGIIQKLLKENLKNPGSFAELITSFEKEHLVQVFQLNRVEIEELLTKKNSYHKVLVQCNNLAKLILLNKDKIKMEDDTSFTD